MSRAEFVFAHGAEERPVKDGPVLIGVYHPSQQNTQTGRVTAEMYKKVLKRIQSRLKES